MTSQSLQPVRFVKMVFIPHFTTTFAFRHFRLLACAFIVVAIAFVASTGRAATSKPNILLIVVDDLGFADLQCMGSSDMRTPAIDRLFAESLRMNRFYANCPVCSPTRASIICGRYPDRVGVPGVIRTNAKNSWGYFSPTAPTLPERLHHLGYATAAIGKWHLGLEAENHPIDRGFDSFQGFLGDMMDDYFDHRRHGINYMRRDKQAIDPPGHATDVFSHWAVDYIADRSNQSSPWFLYLAYNAPHTPIQPPDEWLKKVTDREIGIEAKRAKLVALIEHLDDGIGRVLTSLRESNQFDNTIIVFTSDNGGQLDVGANNGRLRDGKGSMYEGGLRIPGCIRVPGRTSHGTRTDAVCVTMDIFPTLIEIAGEETEASKTSGQLNSRSDGMSWVPLLANATAHWPAREVYFVRREGGPRYGGLTIEAVLRSDPKVGDLKLVHNYPTQSFELFDLSNDPMEAADVSAKQPKLFREMIEQLQNSTQQAGKIPWQKSSTER